MTDRAADQFNSLLSFNPDCETRLFSRDPTAFEDLTDVRAEACAAKTA